MNGAPPSAFPYLCIFQRCDHTAAMPWAPTQEAPLQADSTDDEEDDETPLNKQVRTALPLASASSSNEPVMQTPQVSRKRKTCEPPSSARRAVQGIPTPKCRRLVGKQAPPEVWRTKKPSSLLLTPLPKTVKLWKGARSCQDEDNFGHSKRQERPRWVEARSRWAEARSRWAEARARSRWKEARRQERSHWKEARRQERSRWKTAGGPPSVALEACSK